MQENPAQKESHFDSQQARPNFWHSLERNQKISLVVLAVFVLFLLIFWTIQFRRSLTEPFTYKGENGTSEIAADNSGSDQELKKKDTDSDGLSDWDELNNYKTSPYLEDSDGDGILDQLEISRGTDPNCPEGKECFGSPVVTGNTVSTGTVGEILDKGLDISLASSSQSDMQGLLSGEVTATSLRKMLLDSGMDKQVLDQISDVDLFTVYKDNLKTN